MLEKVPPRVGASAHRPLTCSAKTTDSNAEGCEGRAPGREKYGFGCLGQPQCAPMQHRPDAGFEVTKIPHSVKTLLAEAT